MMIEKGKCPICGRNNGCAFNTGADPKTCWCMTTPVPKGLLSHIPDEMRNISCVCKSCIESYARKVCVVGSLNIDKILTVENFPLKGETIKAQKLEEHFGGKGGNQATALRKLGVSTSMFGCVGSDPLGDKYINNLKTLGVDTSLIKRASGISGQAYILVDQLGENQIVTLGGANYSLDEAWIEYNIEALLDHDIFLFSLEIPQTVSLKLMRLLHKHNKIIILDPAPFSNFHDEMLDYVDYITPNETEYNHLKDILKPSHNVVMKKGAKGSSYIHNNITINVPPYPVSTIDTVGAGDTFNAAFTFALVFKFTTEESLMIANTAGAFATTKKGAQGGMPDLKTLLKSKLL